VPDATTEGMTEAKAHGKAEDAGRAKTPQALLALERSKRWYAKNAWQARRLHYASEVSLLVVAALVPVSAVFTADRRVPAALGAVLVILTGFRSLFRWRDNWVRFTQASVELETARQLYLVGAAPYDGEDRDAVLVQRVREIEATETRGWVETRMQDAKPESKQAQS
jgi:hypothetical protein